MYDLSDGGWLTPEVAQGQQELVEKELQDVLKVSPYAAFLRALEYIGPQPGKLLLDVGCGVGHYGTLLRVWGERYGLTYRGTDASRSMIEVAQQREPTLDFRVCPLAITSYKGVGIVLASSVVEITPTPLAHICRILDEAPGYIIWNRIRLVERSGFISERTYAGHTGLIWLWSWPDISGLLALSGRMVSVIPWLLDPSSCSIVLGPREALAT